MALCVKMPEHIYLFILFNNYSQKYKQLLVLLFECNFLWNDYPWILALITVITTNIFLLSTFEISVKEYCKSSLKDDIQYRRILS